MHNLLILILTLFDVLSEKLILSAICVFEAFFPVSVSQLLAAKTSVESGLVASPPTKGRVKFWASDANGLTAAQRTV
jgi:hypothetical protein